MPRNPVSVEELRVRVMKLKNDLGWEPQDQKEMAQRYLGYVLDILDEYRFQGLTGTGNRGIINKLNGYEM